MADGIGPAIGRMVTWPAAGGAPNSATGEVGAGRETVDSSLHGPDRRPAEELSIERRAACSLFKELRVEGVFTDFPDVTAAWVKQNTDTSRVR